MDNKKTVTLRLFKDRENRLSQVALTANKLDDFIGTEGKTIGNRLDEIMTRPPENYIEYSIDFNKGTMEWQFKEKGKDNENNNKNT